MDDWIDYYDSAHTIYVSRQHRDVHFRLVAEAIIACIASPNATVLDYACGEALAADTVAAACGRLILAEPAPNVRGRLAARFAGNDRIVVVSLDGLRDLPPHSVDLVVVNSVAQYMTAAEFDAALATIHDLLSPFGRLILGDIIPVEGGMFRDVTALLRFGARHGFLKDAAVGLVRTALSEYRQLRNRVGVQRYSESDMLTKLRSAGFEAKRTVRNLGHNPWRMTFEARRSGPVGLTQS